VATKIKLMRLGKKRAPYYRIVVADARTKRDGRVIETIGKYHPKEDPSFMEVDAERAAYWLGVGAQPTEPVAAILRVTGDWQKFKGEPAPAPMRVAAPKVDKAETFATAARALAGIVDVTAPLAPKAAKKAEPKVEKTEAPAKVEEAKVEAPVEAKVEAPAAEVPAAEAAATDTAAE
jgi:small subunit ribosomal protein S16